MRNFVTANNVSFKRSNNVILDKVSLDINEHDFTTIIGPNGAGKSVLVKCLLGLITPDSGEISINKNIKIGFVPQEVNIDHSMPLNVKRFILLNKKSNEEQLRKISELTTIDNLLDKQVNLLSGGELQRVLLARALIGTPDLLVLDEPAQNLDISGQLRFYKILEDVYSKSNISILMVSHDLHLVMSCTKQVICLYKHICCKGEPNVVTKAPEFKTLFGDDMAKMMSIYSHQHNHCH